MIIHFTLWGRSALAVAFLLTLSSCYDFTSDSPADFLIPPPRISCAIFKESLWQEFGFGVDSPTDVVDTVTLLWGSVDETLVEIQSWRSGLWSVDWVHHGDGVEARYSAQSGKERKLSEVRVDMYPQPSLAQIIDCLGAPQSHSATLVPDFEPQLSLALWYVEKGFVVSGVSFDRQVQLTAFQPDFRMTTFSVVPSGSLEEMVSDLYHRTVQTYILCTLRPWPGSIEAIEVESFLEENPRCEQ